MATMTLDDLAEKMAAIDFAMLSTRAVGGQIAARPMSNNGDVGWKGDSYFFALSSTHTVEDIGRDPQVGLTFTGAKGLLGGTPLFVSVEGTAELIRDKTVFEAHWTEDLDIWFEDGLDTSGLVLIKVRAARIHYWDGQDEGELAV